MLKWETLGTSSPLLWLVGSDFLTSRDEKIDVTILVVPFEQLQDQSIESMNKSLSKMTSTIEPALEPCLGLSIVSVSFLCAKSRN